VTTVGSIVNVEVSVDSDSFALGRILRGHEDVRIDLAQFVPLGDQFVPYVWVETEDQSAFEETVETDDRVESLTALDSTGDRTLYRIEWADPQDRLMAAIAAHDLMIENATGVADRWRFRLRGPDRENLAAFQQTLLEQDVPLYIHRIWRPEADGGNPYGLTETQRETLELAYREGYFSVPRRASLQDLGDILGVSHQSVSRRVRVGIENLLESTLMKDERLDSG
jgi:hypothetical protein